VEAYRAVRCRGFHTVQTIGSQMAAKLPAPHAGCALLPQKSYGTHLCHRLNKSPAPCWGWNVCNFYCISLKTWPFTKCFNYNLHISKCAIFHCKWWLLYAEGLRTTLIWFCFKSWSHGDRQRLRINSLCKFQYGLQIPNFVQIRWIVLVIKQVITGYSSAVSISITSCREYIS
jgi:hypothetical protein